MGPHGGEHAVTARMCGRAYRSGSSGAPGGRGVVKSAGFAGHARNGSCRAAHGVKMCRNFNGVASA